MTRLLLALTALICFLTPVYAHDEGVTPAPSGKPQIKSMVYITVTVEDQDAAMKWYVDNLDMTVTFDYAYGEHGERWLTLIFPGQDEMTSPQIVLYKPDHEYDAIRGLAKQGPVSNIYFEVTDCVGMTERLREAGAKIFQEPTEKPYGIETVWYDPDGNLFTMIQAFAAPEDDEATDPG